MSTEITVDVTSIHQLMVAYQSALMSFCKEWKDAYPDKIAQAETYLDSLVERHELPEAAFLKVKRVLRGEDPDQEQTGLPA